MNGPSWVLGGTATPLNKSDVAVSGHLEFCHISLLMYLYKDATRPRDQTEPEVNSHRMTSLVRNNVGRSRRIFELSLVETSRNRQPLWRSMPNSLIVIIEEDGGRHSEFRTVSIYSPFYTVWCVHE